MTYLSYRMCAVPVLRTVTYLWYRVCDVHVAGITIGFAHSALVLCTHPDLCVLDTHE